MTNLSKREFCHLPDCSCLHTEDTKEDWEEEFNRRFPYHAVEFKEDGTKNIMKEIKDFIRDLLSAHTKDHETDTL